MVIPVGEDELDTFEGWLKFQAIDKAAISQDELQIWRELFDNSRQEVAAASKMGLMKLKSTPGEHRYGVAVTTDEGPWTTLWVRRSPKGEFFVLMPRADGSWNPHASYHLDGTFHMKSGGRLFGQPKKYQPLTGQFRGTESLGSYGGHFPKSVGAIFERASFTGDVEVGADVLGPNYGTVVVDLVEPGEKPMPWPFKKLAVEKTFKETTPRVVIRVGSS
jgi:hypothetical protein